MEERLHRFLAHCGVASRRRSEGLMAEGRVTVNGVVATMPGFRVDPARDEVLVDGQPVSSSTASHYLALHKPRGILCTAHDPQGRATVISLLPPDLKIYPVGRLDADSEGLLLLTNDGDMANRVMHPRYGAEREYHVLVRDPLSTSQWRQLREGVSLEDGLSRLRVGVAVRNKGGLWLKVVMGEGRKRQIRRTLARIGVAVERILRVRIGGITLGSMAPGQHRRLTLLELEWLRRELGWPGPRS